MIAAHDGERIAGCAAALMYFLQQRLRSDEGAALLEEPAERLDAERADDRLAAAEVLRALGQLHYRNARTEAAIAESRRALRLFKSIRQREGIKRCLGVLGLSLWQTGALVEAKRCFDDALRLARAAGDAAGVATFVGNVGLIEQALGNDERALALYREALQRNQEVGDLVGVGNQYINLGNLHRARRELPAARRWYEEGRAFAVRHGHVRALPWFAINLALTDLDGGEFARAQELGTLARTLAREAGNPRVEAQALLLLSRLALEQAQFAAARAQIRSALALAAAMNNEPIQLEGIARYGQTLAAEGTVDEAAALWSFVAQHPKTDASIRCEVLEWIDHLPPDARAAAPPLDLPGLAQRLQNAGI
jgi:tetratricopeptide (TPR) repeat protein